MPEQVFRHLRPTVRGEILRSRDDPVPERPELAAHEARILDLACSDDGIEALFDDVDQPIREIEVEVDQRVAVHEIRYGRHQEHAGQGQADTKLAARCRVRPRQLRLGCLEFGLDAATSVEKEAPVLGQRHASRRPIEETHAHLVFEPRDGLADRRTRKAEPMAGGHEAACLCDLNENAERSELVHRLPIAELISEVMRIPARLSAISPSISRCRRGRCAATFKWRAP
ncbi:hypothetical protein D9M72_484910 [compost metagenome]